jgi:hypothetical protein
LVASSIAIAGVVVRLRFVNLDEDAVVESNGEFEVDRLLLGLKIHKRPWTFADAIIL